MNKKIEYTKFETYGYWKQNKETEEIKVVSLERRLHLKM